MEMVYKLKLFCFCNQRI